MVNMLVRKMTIAEKMLNISTKEFFAYLPSAVKNQCIRDAKSIYKKHTKGVTKTIAILKKPVCIWNNQNFSIKENTITFPVWLGKSKKISVKSFLPNQYKARLAGIKVEYADPRYTSQICPRCGEKNKAKDRQYSCSCEYGNHRDVIGATNIMSMIHGNSVSA